MTVMNEGSARPTLAEHSVLVIDDEKLVVWSLQQELEEANYRVYSAVTGTDGLELAKQHEPDVILLDIMLPDINGIDILKEIRNLGLSSVVLMLTALSDLTHAVESVREGAYDYIPKPFELEDVKHRIVKAIRHGRLETEVKEYRSRQRSFGEAFIADSPAMQGVLDLIRRMATQSTSTVLLTGESGVGKDLAAKTIHCLSPRAEGPFIEINCPSFPPQLLESEMFGHERGAFTDAKTRKRGLFEIAEGGTIFLNEIGDVDAAIQAKLLQVLEKKTFRRIGATKEIVADVRIVVATNRNLQLATREGRFREDLFYRLNVLPIHIPPLRDRGDDIGQLAIHFVNTLQKEVRTDRNLAISADALRKLEKYNWPGNVRELRNVIERAILLAGGPEIEIEDLPPEIAHELAVHLQPSAGLLEAQPDAGPGQWGALDETERGLILDALQQANGNQSMAARLLGISRDTLRYRLKKYAIAK